MINSFKNDRSAVWLVVGTLLMLLHSVSSAGAATILTADGEEYVGEVLAATVNTITVKMETGYTMIPRREIVSIRLDVQGGTPVEGRLLDWSDGRFTIRVGSRLISIQDGLVVSDSATAVRPAAQPPEPAPQPIEPAPQAFQPPEPPVQTPVPETVEQGKRPTM